MSKNLVFGEKAKNVTIKLYSWEKQPVKKYIKELRIKKRKEIQDDRGQNFRSESKKVGAASE